MVSVLAPIYKENTKNKKDVKDGAKKFDGHANSLRRSVSMGSLPSQQKRCQLCLFNRYDLHPAKKIFDEKLIYQNRKNVTINNYPTLFKSPGSLKDFKISLEKDETETETGGIDTHQCTVNQDKNSVISCNICGICGKNQANENSGRFTITRNSRKSSLKNTSRHSVDLASSGVSIAVEDWTGNSSKRNQFSRSASMQNNYYENLKQLDNASSNNNNPPYENSAIIQKFQESTDLNRNNKTDVLYAVVNKQNSSSNASSNNNNNNNNNDNGNGKNELLYETISSNIINNNQLKTSSTIQSIPCMTGSTATTTNNSEVYSKVWKGPKKDSTWKCTKCSYAYNGLYIDHCDICDSSRTSSAQQQSSNNKSSNNNDNQSGFTKDNFNNNNNNNNSSTPTPNTKLALSKSTHGFDECFPSNNRIPPMASFEQDLEDDFQFLPADSPTLETEPVEEWACKKCTLVNSGTATVCIVCGGSKLKSTTAVEDMTLRKGEFWACSACTLKNSLGTNICIACKAIRPIPNITKPSNFRPYTGSSPSSTPTTPASACKLMFMIYGTIYDLFIRL